MIPKTIHYCWFGRTPLPKQYRKYIDTWRKYCPEYTIIEWNEDNFDVYQNEYCKGAYENKAWAFVSDYARLKIIYENGGVYLDTDIELVKDITPLISNGTGYIGFQGKYQVNTGLGFAAEKNNYCVKKMLEVYEKRRFIDQNGNKDMTPCPITNTYALLKCGLKIGKNSSYKVQKLRGLNVYPEEFFNPKNVDTSRINVTKKSYSIHHYASSWFTDGQKKKSKLKRLIPGFLLSIRNDYISKRGLVNFIRRYGDR